MMMDNGALKKLSREDGKKKKNSREDNAVKCFWYKNREAFGKDRENEVKDEKGTVRGGMILSVE